MRKKTIKFRGKGINRRNEIKKRERVSVGSVTVIGAQKEIDKLSSKVQPSQLHSLPY